MRVYSSKQCEVTADCTPPPPPGAPLRPADAFPPRLRGGQIGPRAAPRTLAGRGRGRREEREGEEEWGGGGGEG